MIRRAIGVIIVLVLVVFVALQVYNARGFIPWYVEQREPISAK